MPFFERARRRVLRRRRADELLGPMYPEHPDFGPAQRRLSLFLAQYWGGPHTYQRGAWVTRAADAPLPVHMIGPLERDRWLLHMAAAVERTCGRSICPVRRRCDRRRADRLLRARRRAPAQRHRPADHVERLREGMRPWPSSRCATSARRTAVCSAVDGVSFSSPRARCTGCSATTAPASRPPSRSSRVTAPAPPARCRCSASTRRRAGASSATGSASCCRRRGRAASSPCARRSSCTARCTRRRRPIDEVLDLVGLDAKADARIGTLSGGQRRRLDLALGIVGIPTCCSSTSPPPASTRRAPQVVGARAGPVLARHDRAAHHALPRRGRAPRRPGRRADERPAGRRGHARRADRRARRHARLVRAPGDRRVGLAGVALPPAPPSRRIRSGSRRATPTADVHRVTAWAIERGSSSTRCRSAARRSKTCSSARGEHGDEASTDPGEVA
jgi:hypothetical protein